MKHFIGGFSAGVILFEVIVAAILCFSGKKVVSTWQANAIWGFFVGLAAWGLL